MELEDRAHYEELQRDVEQLDRITNSGIVKAVDYTVATLCAAGIVYCASQLADDPSLQNIGSWFGAIANSLVFVEALGGRVYDKYLINKYNSELDELGSLEIISQ